MENEILEKVEKPVTAKNVEAALGLDARAYFLNQGQSINRINDILDTSLISYHFKTLVSVITEAVLYILFTAIIGLIIAIPSEPSEISYAITRLLQNNEALTTDDLSMVILTFKFVVTLLTLPLAGMAILLRRNRKRRKMINRAAGEAYNMKTAFYKAVNELKL